MTFEGDPQTFDTREFKRRLCRNLFTPSCDTGDIRGFQVTSGSTNVRFEIKFKNGGPTVRHMRTQLVDPLLVQNALDPNSQELFQLTMPYEIRMKELTDHRSNDDLMFEMNAYKTIGAANFIFFLGVAWFVAVAWAITSRGQSCRQRAHSGWREAIMPSGETLQVFVLSSYFQIILSILAHTYIAPAPSSSAAFQFVYLYGIIIGVIGAAFIAILNAWIRGESISLRNALSVAQIDRLGGSKEWEGDDDEDDGGDRNREYRQVYVPGSDRTLGGLASHDWEKMHLDMEKSMGLFDLSDNVFDEKPKEDNHMLAAFLNSKLTELFTGKKEDEQMKAKPSAVKPELLIASVEVPVGLPKSTLRDALLQWRLRHTAHPQEMEALDWMLGQLDPAFELLAVKVPEQSRLHIIEALIQHNQNHAELQLDASHSARMLSTMQQLGTRFHGTEVTLPDDGQHTDKTRALVVEALKNRLEKSKTDITQEEGALLQLAMHALQPGFNLVAMPYDPSPADTQLAIVKGEIEKRADEIRATNPDYMYDDEIFTPVTLLCRTKPPDHVEELQRRRPGQGRKSLVAEPSKSAVKKTDAKPAAATSASKPELPSVNFAGSELTQIAEVSEKKEESEKSFDPLGGAVDLLARLSNAASPAPSPPPSADGYGAAVTVESIGVESIGATGVPASREGSDPSPAPSARLPAAPDPSLGVAAAPVAAPSPPPSPPAVVRWRRAPVSKLGVRRVPSLHERPLTSPPASPPADEDDVLARLSNGDKEALPEDAQAEVKVAGDGDDGAIGWDDEPEAEVPTMEKRGSLKGGWSQPGLASHAALEGSSKSLGGSSKSLLEEPPQKLTTLQAGKLIWRLWRQKMKADGNGDHEQMPCWKQYTVLFIGSIIVFVCTVAVTTLFTIIPPIAQYFSLFSFVGSMPLSIILHFVSRTVLRYLRKWIALHRGRNIEGAFSSKVIKGKATRESVYGLTKANKDINTRVSAAGATDYLKTARMPVAAKPAMLTRDQVSAHLTSKLDQTKGFADHVIETQGGPAVDATAAGLTARTQRGAKTQRVQFSNTAAKESDEVKRVTGVMNRNSFDLDARPQPQMSARPQMSSRRAPPQIGRAASKGSALGRAEKILNTKANPNATGGAQLPSTRPATSREGKAESLAIGADPKLDA